jgi:CBS-domain-containing membrane protein
VRVLSLPRLARQHQRRFVYAVFGFVSSAVSVGVIALAASFTHQPLVFPSLGPTAFLIFDRPRVTAAAPRNIVLGHLIGVIAGVVSLAAFGLLGESGPAQDITPMRVLAAAVSLGLTVGAMVLVRVPHAPAAATTLIVSLGYLRRSVDLFALVGAVVALALQGLVIDRVVGIDYPVWASPRPPVQPPG